MPASKIKAFLGCPLIALSFLGAVHAMGAVPDWLQTAARDSLLTYADDIPAVMLRNEQIVTVKDNGEVTTVYRYAYKILRPEGRPYAQVQIYFDSETRITSIKGWSIPAAGASYEIGEKDSIDTVLYSDNLYDDARQKLFRIPAGDPGAVVGYEYEQRGRTAILQEQWLFQQEIPVRRARFELRLPSGWEYREVWANHTGVPPQGRANQPVWELRDIAPIRAETSMPAWRATAGQLLLTFFAPKGSGSFKSWNEVGQWYTQLAADRRRPSPNLSQKALDLTTGAPSAIGKIQALASFVQQEVRYVAIQIGIGGYQPHAAQEIFRNRYGDCKDKATLLSTMLSEIGVESYYVLINTSRGILQREFPSMLAFNHAILAIRMPPDAPMGDVQSGIQHPQLGPLLFFDPTHPYVRFGHLPSELHANDGLLVGGSGGELTRLPLAPASVNSLHRTLELQLTPDGALQGDARETRTGTSAADFRSAWLNLSESDRKKDIQASFGRQTTAIELENVSLTGLDTPDRDPTLRYEFRLARYATSTGNLLLIRPRILAEWSDDLMENGERHQPVEFSAAALRTEIIEIILPDGYAVDELPPPIEATIGTISYASKTEVNGRVLRYSRRLEVKDVLVSVEQLRELKQFYRQIVAGEKASAVLKKQ